jgi:hypothetical protein
MYYVREQSVRNLLEASLSRELDKLPPRSGLFGGIGAGRGVEENESCDALRGIPHDLQGHVATHGQSGQGEPFRRRVQDRACHLQHGGASRDIRDDRIGEVRDMLRLMPPESVVAQQTGHEHQRCSCVVSEGPVNHSLVKPQRAWQLPPRNAAKRAS